MSQLAILVVLLCVLYGEASAAIRGLDPANAAHYTGAGGIFTCLDGSKTIPFDQVNDNYCDCQDGSDEPGTPACYHGMFYCRNKGHVPQTISTSFVDDGICDCCDGSDDAGCQNTCLDKSASVVHALKEKVDSYANQLQQKSEKIDEGNRRRAVWLSRSATIGEEIAAKSAEVELARDAHSKAQAENADKLEAKEKARQAEENEAMEKAEAEQRRVQEEAAARASQQAATDDHQGEVQPDDGVEHEETVEERGRRIAAQWTTDPDAAAVEEEDVDEDHDQGHYDPDEGHDHEDDHEYDEEHQEHEEEQWSQEFTEATRKLNQAEFELRELLKEQADMEQYSSGQYDFGPNNEFFPLAGRCISDFGNTFVYQACFFDNATQAEPRSNKPKVNLGTWRGFTDDYTQALFDGGDPCPDAPARSLRVFLICGSQEQLYSSSEPSTCVYETWLMTPLACSEAEYQNLTAELLQLELEREEMRKEIEAEAAAAAKQHDEL